MGFGIAPGIRVPVLRAGNIVPVLRPGNIVPVLSPGNIVPVLRPGNRVPVLTPGRTVPVLGKTCAKAGTDDKTADKAMITADGFMGPP